MTVISKGVVTEKKGETSATTGADDSVPKALKKGTEWRWHRSQGVCQPRAECWKPWVASMWQTVNRDTVEVLT